MTQMSSMGEVKSHKSIMRLHDCLVYLQIGRASTEALDVDSPLLWVQVERLQGSRLASQLDLVDVLISTIVTSSGVTLRVLV